MHEGDGFSVKTLGKGYCFVKMTGPARGQATVGLASSDLWRATVDFRARTSGLTCSNVGYRCVNLLSHNPAVKYQGNQLRSPLEIFLSSG